MCVGVKLRGVEVQRDASLTGMVRAFDVMMMRQVSVRRGANEDSRQKLDDGSSVPKR